MTKRSDFQLPVRTSIDADARVIAWDPTDTNGEPFVVPTSALAASLAADAAFSALYEPVQVGTNTHIGLDTHTALTTGVNNAVFGEGSQRLLTSGNSNAGFGKNAQSTLTTGTNNASLGTNSQSSLVDGSSNVAVGANAQRSLTTSNDNVAMGSSAQWQPGGVGANGHTSTSRCSSFGTESGLGSATQDNDITTIGYRALATGAGATSLGSGAHAAFTQSVALGMSTVSTAASQVHLGSRHMEMVEITAPAAGATNSARIFAEDDGAGKTRLMVRFATGAVQQLAIEP